ncbi:hypothetical protein K438DRAFT_1989919 [Mycena galopus ATCC 62051]|nr:hypothetical protein K438DRAFT_1989919 [Mycena galopus ATCC 62051]
MATASRDVYTGKIMGRDHQFGLVDICNDFTDPEATDGILGLAWGRQQRPAISTKGETLNFDACLRMGVVYG